MCPILTYRRGMTSLAPPVPADLPRTLGALRASGYVPRTVKEEIRDNLVARLAAGEPTFPGIVGFDDTVIPQVERALLAGHDIVLLGERGQGKTRLIRTLVTLLDEWIPVVDGSEVNDDPMAPVSAYGRRIVAERGDDTPVSWRHRSERYGEKLATPDTSVGDLVGDVDPVKVAEGRTLGDPETIHFGLVPRTNRGIFAINELPDLAERIQVALLNVLEERDIQVRGYTLRLPLDLLVMASANPEDYTNRGRIITPMKDRFGAEITTHYPYDVQHEVGLIAQEADLVAIVPMHLLEVIARFTRLVRESGGMSAHQVLAPLLVSVVVRAFGWSVLLGNGGLINQALQLFGIGPVKIMYTELAIVIALVHVMLPFMIIPVWTSLQKLDPSAEQAALSLGVSQAMVMRSQSGKPSTSQTPQPQTLNSGAPPPRFANIEMRAGSTTIAARIIAAVSTPADARPRMISST